MTIGFFVYNCEVTPIPHEGQAEDVVMLKSSVIVFYLQRYAIHNSFNLKQIKQTHYLKNKIVKPTQVQEELIAAVEPRGKLIILNPYKNEILEILELPMISQRTNSEWFYFNQYYIFHKSRMFTYREEGPSNTIGLATYKNKVKVSSVKYNIAVKGSNGSSLSSIDQFDDNCSLAIYEPIVKRALFKVQLATLPSNEIALKEIQLGELFSLHSNIRILYIRGVNQQLFMICLKSDSVKTLFLLINSQSNEITYVIQSSNRFIRPLFNIRNNANFMLFQSASINPPTFMMDLLEIKEAPTISNIGEIISGNTLVQYGCRRMYKWWTDQEGKGVFLHIWSIIEKNRLYMHLLRSRRIDKQYGDSMCRIVLRLLV